MHGQVRRRLHLTGRVGGATRVDARVLRVGGLDQQHGVVAFLDHLLQDGQRRTREKIRDGRQDREIRRARKKREFIPKLPYLKVARWRDDLALAHPLDRRQRSAADQSAELHRAALDDVDVFQVGQRRRDVTGIGSFNSDIFKINFYF